jgi:Ca-activated chloride channel family protein
MWSILTAFVMTISLSLLSLPAFASERPANLAKGVNPGTLEVLQLGDKKPDKKLELPLKHTDVNIEVSGFVASATVTQHYHNPFKKPIEAVYTFPLPNDAAVDDMQMKIGERTIKGVIKRRQEAREIYERARERGQRASLLEQERPNIFTQSVANIMPGDNIVVTIRYVNILRYAKGNYELVFPMVVGPRYIPGNVATGQSGTGWAPDTDVVPDASRITPPVLKPGERSGHDIALSVKLDAGVPIKNVISISHVVDIKDINAHEQHIQLNPADTIPNKDFVLRYQVAGMAPEMAVIAHHDERGGFFTLIIQPQRTVTDDQVVARELIFIVDTSGSMRGFPIEKSKEAMRRLINGMRSTDTFNVVRFAGDTGTLWNKPKPNTAANVNEALRYIESFRGRGGTQMREGILDALAQPAAKGYLRIALLLTDGYVGNERGIFQAIEKERRGARVFTLGVGSSVNRYLLDRAAEFGRGEAFYVRQDENSDKVINKFFQRVDRPVLTDIEIDWGKLDVTERFPAKVPDLWAGQPIRLHGRYTKGGEEAIVVRGQLRNRPYEQKLRVELPQNEPAHAAMATVWARQKVRQLMNKMVRARGQRKELIEQITQLGLTFRLMTQWTSFVAVEEKVVNVDGKPQTVVQPVEMPEDVSYEGVFGEQPVPTAAYRGLRSKGSFSARSAKRSKRRASRPNSARRSKSRSSRPNSARRMPRQSLGQFRGGRGITASPSFAPPPAPPAVKHKDAQKRRMGPSLPTAPSAPPATKYAPKPSFTPPPSAPPVAVAPEALRLRPSAPKPQLTQPPTPTGKNAPLLQPKTLAQPKPNDKILFEPGKATLTKQAKRQLDKWATKICQNLAHIKKIVIIGHADSGQADNFKQKLSLERAVAVFVYLLKQCPTITSDKLDIKGEADRQPIADNSTAEGRALNRRVEISVFSDQ